MFWSQRAAFHNANNLIQKQIKSQLELRPACKKIPFQSALPSTLHKVQCTDIF